MYNPQKDRIILSKLTVQPTVQAVTCKQVNKKTNHKPVRMIQVRLSNEVSLGLALRDLVIWNAMIRSCAMFACDQGAWVTACGRSTEWRLATEGCRTQQFCETTFIPSTARSTMFNLHFCLAQLRLSGSVAGKK